MVRKTREILGKSRWESIILFLSFIKNPCTECTRLNFLVFIALRTRDKSSYTFYIGILRHFGWGGYLKLKSSTLWGFWLVIWLFNDFSTLRYRFGSFYWCSCATSGVTLPKPFGTTFFSTKKQLKAPYTAMDLHKSEFPFVEAGKSLCKGRFTIIIVKIMKNNKIPNLWLNHFWVV